MLNCWWITSPAGFKRLRCTRYFLSKRIYDVHPPYYCHLSYIYHHLPSDFCCGFVIPIIKLRPFFCFTRSEMKVTFCTQISMKQVTDLTLLSRILHVLRECVPFTQNHMCRTMELCCSWGVFGVCPCFICIKMEMAFYVNPGTTFQIPMLFHLNSIFPVPLKLLY